MPYPIRKRDDKFCVLDKDGKTITCHDTRADAEDHQRALYAAENKSFVFKAQDRHYMLLIASNAYEDREDETVKQKALQNYVDHFKPTPHLYWHGGDPIGEIIAAEMHGPFLLEVSRELPDATINLARGDEPPFYISRKAIWDVIEKNTIPWGASLGFYYEQGDEQDGAFEAILKKETSTLPLEDAANGITLSNVIGGEPMSDAVKTKRRNVLELLGLKSDEAKSIDAALEGVREALDNAGVARKEFDKVKVKGLVEDLHARAMDIVRELTDDEAKAETAVNNLIADLMGTATQVVEEIPTEEMADGEDEEEMLLPEEMRELTEAVKALVEESNAREAEIGDMVHAFVEITDVVKQLAPLTKEVDGLVGLIQRMDQLEAQLKLTPKSVATPPKFSTEDIKKALDNGGKPQRTVLGIPVKE